MLPSPGGRQTLALGSDGVAYVFDSITGQLLTEQRLVWAEPTPSRAVEGREKFLKWRKDSSLDVTEDSPEASIKAGEVVKVSALLGEFLTALPAGKFIGVIEGLFRGCRGIEGYRSYRGGWLSCFIRSGALDCSDVLLSHPLISLASHTIIQHTDIYLFLKYMSAAGGHGKAFDVLASCEESGLLAVNCSIISGAICFHDSTSLARLYRIRAPGKLSNDLSAAVTNISYGRLQKDRPALRQCVGAVSSLRIWSQKCLVLCTIVGSDKLHIVSMLTGDPVIELQGHSGDITSMSLAVPQGIVFTGAMDKTVRIWQGSSCIPYRLATIGGFDDPSMVDMENRVTSGGGGAGGVGAGSRQVLRTLSTQLNSALSLVPQWRRGRISSFYDGKKYLKEAPIDVQLSAVEVVFENASVQMFHNRNALRQPQEAVRAPNGPPFWGEPEVALTLGRSVAVYDIDPEAAAVACARSAGVASSLELTQAELVDVIKGVLGYSTTYSDESAERVDVKNAMASAGYEPNDRASLYSVIRRIYALQGREVSQCDRLLCGNVAPIAAISFSQLTKLLVTIDQSGCCCVWDPVGSRASLTGRSMSMSMSMS